VELITIFYCIRFETLPTWRARSPYLYCPGIGSPGYISRHRVPFSSPRMTRRAMVEVFEPASTWAKNYWSSVYSPSTARIENASSIIACSVVAGETCPQSCSLAMTVVLSPVYTAVTWQWVYMSQYFVGHSVLHTAGVTIIFEDVVSSVFIGSQSVLEVITLILPECQNQSS
jgi:hypothetical protein